MKLKPFYLLIIISLITCCVRSSKLVRDNSIDEKIMVNKLYIPDSLDLYIEGRPNLLSKVNLFNKKTLIYHLNGDCDACINSLNEWNELIHKNFTVYNLNILVIAHVSELDLFKMFLKEVNIKYPIYIDPYDEFFFKNMLTQSQRYEMFLVDCDKTILAMGNLLYDNKSMSIFLDVLNNKTIN